MSTLPRPSPAGRVAGRLAALACQALLDEADLTPKPGLVDRRGPGMHQDLSLALMHRSARALHGTFHAMALAAHGRATTPDLRETLGHLGRQGEAVMMRLSGGVNTHRGAIWALGLLVAAAAQDEASNTPAAIAARAAGIARLPDRLLPAQSRKGAIACHTYGVGGARAEAQQGFPHVLRHALPALYATRARGQGETAAQLNALLAIMSRLDDTCLLSRGGWPALHAGGVGCWPGRLRLRALERCLCRHQASPGGAADLLAATLLLDRLQQAGSACPSP